MSFQRGLLNGSGRAIPIWQNLAATKQYPPRRSGVVPQSRTGFQPVPSGRMPDLRCWPARLSAESAQCADRTSQWRPSQYSFVSWARRNFLSSRSIHLAAARDGRAPRPRRAWTQTKSNRVSVDSNTVHGVRPSREGQVAMVSAVAAVSVQIVLGAQALDWQSAIATARYADLGDPFTVYNYSAGLCPVTLSTQSLK